MYKKSVVYSFKSEVRSVMSEVWNLSPKSLVRRIMYEVHSIKSVVQSHDYLKGVTAKSIHL